MDNQKESSKNAKVLSFLKKRRFTRLLARKGQRKATRRIPFRKNRSYVIKRITMNVAINMIFQHPVFINTGPITYNLTYGQGTNDESNEKIQRRSETLYQCVEKFETPGHVMEWFKQEFKKNIQQLSSKCLKRKTTVVEMALHY